jgi:hypothetical protein
MVRIFNKTKGKMLLEKKFMIDNDYKFLLIQQVKQDIISKKKCIQETLTNRFEKVNLAKKKTII